MRLSQAGNAKDFDLNTGETHIGLRLHIQRIEVRHYSPGREQDRSPSGETQSQTPPSSWQARAATHNIGHQDDAIANTAKSQPANQQAYHGLLEIPECQNRGLALRVLIR